MRKPILIGVTLAFLAAALAGCAREAPAPPPPPAVKVAAVLQRDVPVYVEAIGQTRGSTEIEIRARVEGFLETVNFKEGSVVRKGDLLYTIDPSELEATLAQARGRQAQAEAELARARQDVVRYEPLVAKNAISRQEYETSVAVERAAQASLEAAKAATRSAEIDLGYAKIYAPEDGLVGKTEVYPGSLVRRLQSNLMTQISRIDPIHVRFTIAERDYLRFARRAVDEGRPGRQQKAPLELVLADGSIHPHAGSMVFVDRNVDPRTGTILLEAAFPNPERIVRPGQYARVRAAVDQKPGAILVPQRAIQELQGIDSVAVVDAADTVESRTVTAAERVGSLRVIDTGLKAGERIIVEGLQKVRPGMKVSVEAVTISDAPAATAASTETK